MSGGQDAPRSSPWSVIYDAALLRLLDTRPSPSRIDQVVAWVDRCKVDGPPHEAVLVRAKEPDLFYAIVPNTEEDGASLVVEYLVVEDDREALIIVREIV